ncbi:MAG: aminotransferase class I/II-fold pyridoxal phosphate-dependent enzyme [Propionibacteriaceae bacterium]|nr:aminotransferase class I/II-fold pyridoxal phosphate-dependent enzyme [Propionibacteriaceae bacterium]
MTERIFLSSPDMTAAEQEALSRAFAGGWIAPLGPEVDAFEAELAAYCGREHAVVLSSGTAALHLAGLVLGWGPGDVVVTASMTFAATTNAISYTGATPVLVDSTPEGDIDVELTRRAVKDQLDRGRRVVGLVPVDLLGHIVDHDGLGQIAEEFELAVLSDAAESLGAVRHGRPAASFGDLSAVSFNGNKVMTTSGGGALLTDDGDQAARVRYLATQARQPVLHYEHTDIGYNYRMSNLLAALGRAQLARLPEMLERRRQHRLGYRRLFDGVPGVSFFGQPDGSEHAIGSGADHDNFWLTSVVIDPARAGFSRDELIAALAADGIEARPLWKPMHAQPVFQHLDSYVNGNSDRLFAQGISLPSGSALSDQQMARVHASIRKVIGR